jgi:serine/threonine-protein kinase
MFLQSMLLRSTRAATFVVAGVLLLSVAVPESRGIQLTRAPGARPTGAAPAAPGKADLDALLTEDDYPAEYTKIKVNCGGPAKKSKCAMLGDGAQGAVYSVPSEIELTFAGSPTSLSLSQFPAKRYAAKVMSTREFCTSEGPVSFGKEQTEQYCKRVTDWMLYGVGHSPIRKIARPGSGLARPYFFGSGDITGQTKFENKTRCNPDPEFKGKRDPNGVHCTTVIMQHIDGKPLGAWEAVGSTFRHNVHSVSQLMMYVKQIGRALQILHDEGLGHIDVKAENIMVTGKLAYLVDYGYAGNKNVVRGTPGLINADFFKAKNFPFAAIDSYALGLTGLDALLEMVDKAAHTSFWNFRTEPSQIDRALSSENLIKPYRSIIRRATGISSWMANRGIPGRRSAADFFSRLPWL